MSRSRSQYVGRIRSNAVMALVVIGGGVLIPALTVSTNPADVASSSSMPSADQNLRGGTLRSFDRETQKQVTSRFGINAPAAVAFCGVLLPIRIPKNFFIAGKKHLYAVQFSGVSNSNRLIFRAPVYD